jgi:hypothetical protein
LICHRLLRKEQINGHWFLYCRGDASPAGSDKIDEKMIEGKVAAVISGAKAINLETRRQRLKAMVILSLLAPAIAGISEIYRKLRKL